MGLEEVGIIEQVNSAEILIGIHASFWHSRVVTYPLNRKRSKLRF
jgi:hypothetical protein